MSVIRTLRSATVVPGRCTVLYHNLQYEATLYVDRVRNITVLLDYCGFSIRSRSSNSHEAKGKRGILDTTSHQPLVLGCNVEITKRRLTMTPRGGEYLVKEDGLQYQHDPDASGPCTPEEFLLRFRSVRSAPPCPSCVPRRFVFTPLTLPSNIHPSIIHLKQHQFSTQHY